MFMYMSSHHIYCLASYFFAQNYILWTFFLVETHISYPFYSPYNIYLCVDEL